MSPSPESTGGTGFTFEDAVVAFYFVSLLAEGGARGLPEALIDTVRLQQASIGNPLDDVIIDATNRVGQPATLSLQAKQSITLSAAETNSDFRAVVNACIEEFRKTTFRHGSDRLGLATENIAADALKAARAMTEWARSSVSAIDFFKKIQISGFASDRQRKFVDDIRTLLPGEYQDDENTWSFLKHFIILQFDTTQEGASHAFHAVERLRHVLPASERGRADELWRHLCLLARKSAGVAGSFSRATLVEKLAPTFSFSESPSRRQDILKISEETRLALNSIKMDMAGVVVPRPKVLQQIESQSTGKRFVQLVGEPGSGKSAVLRELAEIHLDAGFALVLTDKRMVGPGWSALATHLGLETQSIVELLLELANAEYPTIFIDGIDRLDESARQTVSDILTKILDDHRLSGWKIVASARSSHLEDLRVWLPSQLVQDNLALVVEVNSFDDTEAEFISERFPSLRELLFSGGAEREIARRPFFTENLARRTAGQDVPNIFSEISLAETWLAGPVETEKKPFALERRRAIVQLAHSCARSRDRTTNRENVSSEVLAELISERTLLEIEGRDRYVFTHDIYLEWCLLGLCLQSGTGWIEVLESAGDRPGLIRVVELLSQFEFEKDGDWIAIQTKLEKIEDKKHWSRVWLIAPFSSPLFFERNVSVSDFLSDKNRLIRLLSSFRSHKTMENLWVVQGGMVGDEIDRFERFRLADMLSWPRPAMPWRRMLLWLLELEWSDETAVDVIDTFDVWLNVFQEYPDKTKLRFAERLDEILSQWDTRYVDWRSEVKPLGYRIDGFGAKLRHAFIRASLTDAGVMKKRVSAWGRLGVRDEVQKSVFDWANRISTVASGELAEFAYQAFISPLPSETAEHTRDQIFSWSPHSSDWDSPGLKDHAGLYPGSPLQQPFAALFSTAPEEALRLVRRLLARSAIAWRELPNYDYRNNATPLPVVLSFPWGEQQFWGDDKVYCWYRGVFASDILVSALMALEDWAFAQLEAGCDPDEIVKKLVTGHESAAVLGIALGILLESHSASPVALEMVGCQRLWALDENRWKNDVTGSWANEIGVFSGAENPGHLEALRRINARTSRKKNIKHLCAAFVLSTDSVTLELKQRLDKFPRDLPYTHEGQDSNNEFTEFLRKRAEEWALHADPATYQIVESNVGDLVGVVRPPSEEQAQRGEEAADRLSEWDAGIQLMNEANACLEAWVMEAETLSRILTAGQEIDTEDLFSKEYDAGDPASYRASGVAAAAAAILSIGSDSDSLVTSWAIDVAFRASRVATTSNGYSSKDAPADKRPETFAAQALAAIVQKELTRKDEAKEELLRLSFNYYQGVSLTALTSSASCWQVDSKFSSESIALAFKVATLELDRGTVSWRKNLENRDQNIALEKAQLFDACMQQISSGDTPPSLAECISPIVSSSIDQWRVRDFAFAVLIIPTDRFVQDMGLQNDFLAALKIFVGNLAEAMKNDEEGSQRGNSSLKIEFERCIWKLAELSKVMGPQRVLDKVVPILSLLEDKPRSEIVSSFAEAYSTICVLDESEIVPGTLDVFIELFDATKGDSDWEWYGSRRLEYGLPHSLLSLVRIAMGLNWEQPHSGASRFVNGDWSEASILDPSIDWMLNTFGHLPQVVEMFLLHTELSFEHRNSEYFALTLARLPQKIWISRDFWSGNMKTRLSALLQSFAEREAPLTPNVHRQFLEILDYLAEYGDRRAAALQRSSLFDFPRVTIE